MDHADSCISARPDKPVVRQKAVRLREYFIDTLTTSNELYHDGTSHFPITPPHRASREFSEVNLDNGPLRLELYEKTPSNFLVQKVDSLCGGVPLWILIEGNLPRQRALSTPLVPGIPMWEWPMLVVALID